MIATKELSIHTELRHKVLSDITALLQRINDIFLKVDFATTGFPATIVELSTVNPNGHASYWNVRLSLPADNPFCQKTTDVSHSSAILLEIQLPMLNRFPHHLNHNNLFNYIVRAYCLNQNLEVSDLLQGFDEKSQAYAMLQSAATFLSESTHTVSHRPLPPS